MTNSENTFTYHLNIFPPFSTSSEKLEIPFGEESSTDPETIDLSVSNETDRSLSIIVDIDFNQPIACMIATEKVLAREWNTPEEDEAWADL